MSDSRNFAALEWVVHEIIATLKEARDALETYVENPNDEARLRFCLTHIHQVHGSLQLVEFHGAGMLAEEMENLAQAMLSQSVANTSEAQEVLMRAILQFPVYLEKVKTSRRDNPIIILPLLNDLRAVRGESLLTETRLFSPHMAPARQASGERLSLVNNSEQFKDTLRKLRQMYQYAAAGFIRGINPDENLAYLKKVFERLYKLTRGTVRQPLWRICTALAEALEMDAIESSVSVKNLLRQLDQELKQMVVHGAKVLDVPADEQLLRNLLYYVARSGKHTPGFPKDSHLQAVYQAYELERALPEGNEVGGEGEETQDMLSAPDSEAMKSVVTALKSELEIIKQALDVSLSDDDRRQALEEALPVVKRVADTMAVLGIGDLRKQVLEQGAALELMVNAQRELSDDDLMAMAGKVLDIEGRLDTLAATQGESSDAEKYQSDLNLSQAQESVLRESRSGLEQVKDAIVEYIASQWDIKHLQSAPKNLREIRGGLEMIPLNRPARILGACARYIEEQLLASDRTPDWARLDTLADAITSVEYYLERFNREEAEENDLLLGVAEDSVAQLGYAVAKSRPDQGPVAEPEVAQEWNLDTEEIEMSLPADDAEEALSAAYESALKASDADSPEEADPEPGEDYSVSRLEEEVAAADALERPEEPEVPAAPEVSKEDRVNPEDQDEVDPEIVDIFIEEAGEVSEAIDEYFPRWARDFSDQEALAEFRRAFHTLKGSGRMVGASDIGELAWAVEHMLNRVLEGSVTPSDRHVAVIERVRTLLPEMIEAFRCGRGNPHPEQTQNYRDYADALARGEEPPPLAKSSDAPDRPASEESDAQSGESTLEQLAAHVETADSEEDDRDGQLWEIFGVEALSHLQVVDQYTREMEEVAPLYTPPSDATQRALHTLKGSAHMANIMPIAELATPLERFVKELRTYQVNINDDILQLLRDAVDYTTEALADIEQGREVTIPRLNQFLARVNELRELYVAPLARKDEAPANGQRAIDPELLSIFMAEEMNLLLDADKILENWQRHPDDTTPLEPLRVELATLTDGAGHANQIPMAELGDKLHRLYQAITTGRLTYSQRLFDALKPAHMALLDLVDAVAVGQTLVAAPEEIQAPLDRFLADLEPAADANEQEEPEPPSKEPSAEQRSSAEQGLSEEQQEPSARQEERPSARQEERPSARQEEGPSATEAESSAVQTETSAEEPTPSDNRKEQPITENKEATEPSGHWAEPPETESDEDEIDEEIVEIFLEEADELIEEIDRALGEWQEDWSNPDLPEELKRSLHTLKGGARLSGITEVGDMAHDFETLLIGMHERDSIDRAFFQRLTDFQDKIHAGIARARAVMAGGASSDKDQGASEQTQDASAQPAKAPPPQEAKDAKVLPFAAKPKPGAVATPAPPGAALSATGGGGGGHVQHLAARRSGPQEMVRVSAELLEELVNLAGETSITRGRIEEQVGDLGMAVDEMDSTISRLQEQLRRLDIETEAQVLFRQEQMEAQDDFDPLEMDRYSQLQQLSRSLMESAYDLLDLKNTLSDKNRDTETLLLQQSRINTDLQEGLMRSRMVPFSRLVPRLRRIVRQAASELGKEVDFQLDNVEGELDRSVLERMVAPLEHMLRNAVDHGLEPPEEREQTGKPRTGRILLSLAREGGEVKLRLVDDGRGINLERVKAKAIERGLMSAEARLSDRDIMQFILHAGFSTADKVTQISGRGVGMDVVHSEIKQLGGAMFINSEAGQGTEFIVRLPFTVSVNRALMIQIGDDYYAVPLNTIEGIVRVSPFELEHYYQDENARFEYAGEQYQVRYLGTMLDSQARPKLDGQSLPLPVVLVRSAENTVALQVDRLLGSSEIVVKTLGAQFSAVSGVSGATVMGDGSVVVILDPHALIREKLAQGLPQATLLEPIVSSREDIVDEKTVMVVDDSVTVRKVTGRFLEREGYRVLTAKDGAEALIMLQDHIPDVMLLDIEMPRMDGFEVATNIRTSSRLKHIPIIMITSRTGDKHRERAFNIGVDKYMGKPYQEEKLLTGIRELLAKARDA